MTQGSELEIPEIGLDLTVKAAFERQEFITIVAPLSFWEGRVNIRSEMNGEPVTGLGFVERTWFDELSAWTR
jgi:predicted secreted hydrolase